MSGYNPNTPARREWCIALAKLVSPAFPNEAASALIDMLPALRHLPESLFSERSLLEVAERKHAPRSGRQATPAFDEIIAALHEYRRRYLPDPTLRLAAPACEPESRRGPCPEEVAVVTELVASWRQEVAQRQIERAEMERDARPKVRPMADVTMKGEVLRRSREARGLVVRERA